MVGLLEERRKNKQITQQAIADKIGVSRQYYNELENGKRLPSVKIAKKIGVILDVDWTIFFNN